MTTKAKTPNPYRISAREFFAENGLADESDRIEFLESTTFEGIAPALCREGCDVEPDGRCSHGCPSILLALGYV